MLSRTPQIQIHQQYGRIGIDADLGQYEIYQRSATQEITTDPAKLEMNTTPAELIIDNSKWRDAMGNGPFLEVMNRIYSQCRSIALQGIAKTVEDGNRMAQIHTGENVIASLARESTNDIDFYEYMYMGEASLDNIDIQYNPAKVNLNYTPAHVNHRIKMNPPEIQYHRGKLEIYMLQYPKVEVTPPQMDVKI